MGDPVVVELVGALGPVYAIVRQVITATRLVVDVSSVTVEVLLAAPVADGRAIVETFEVRAPAPAAPPKTARVRRPRRAKTTTETADTAATVAAGEGTDGG